MFRQKDIVLIPFPYSDLTGSKQRPALILSNETLKGDDEICCLITSNPKSGGMKIEEKCFNEGKLPFSSFVKPERLFTINSKIIRKKLGSITNRFHNNILENVIYFLK